MKLLVLVGLGVRAQIAQNGVNLEPRTADIVDRPEKTHMKMTSARSTAGAGIAAMAAFVGAAAGAPRILVASAALTSVVIAVLSGFVQSREIRGAEGRIAELSHELKTPLTAVVGLLDILDDSGSIQLEAEERDELIRMARYEAAVLDRQISNLYFASRLSRNTLSAKREPVDLRSVAVSAIGQFPDASGRTFVGPMVGTAALGDPGLIHQIITNLVQNLERYAPGGSVEIDFERQDDKVSLLLSDDGPGIPKASWEGVFARGSSDLGLGLGLSLSRHLAHSMGGDLNIVSPRRKGATFQLDLPHSDLQPGLAPKKVEQGHKWALSPRARILLDMTEALTERSVDRMVARLQKLYAGLLGAEGGLLMVLDASGGFSPAGTFGTAGGGTIPDDDPIIADVVDSHAPAQFANLPDDSPWKKALGGEVALFLPVEDEGVLIGVLAIGWAEAVGLPDARGFEVALAMANLAGLAIARSTLAADVVFERGLRASVMESLPIAISVFAGDPPRVIDMNRSERQMLGLGPEDLRHRDLDMSQRQFEVRFADGTPLTVETAPVTLAIRSGKSEGPFRLLIRRADGTEVVTRTYCAPFFDEDGVVTGAVVTSEEIVESVHTAEKSG